MRKGDFFLKERKEVAAIPRERKNIVTFLWGKRGWSVLCQKGR